MRPHLHRPLLAALLVAAGVVATPSALAQKSNEIFIPVGQSPGLSGKHTLMGRVQSCDAANNSLIVTDAAGTAVTVGTHTKTSVWLDRSKLRQTNIKGALTDCRKDLSVEVKYRDNDARSAMAEWIKLQAPE